MQYRIALRTASILSILHGVMHQLGMSNTSTNEAEVALNNSMRSFTMNLMSSVRSYWDIFAGMGLFLTMSLVALGGILWLLSAVQPDDRRIVRPLLIAIGCTFSVFALASVRFFFAAPIIMEALVAILVFHAWHVSRRVA